MLVQRIRHPWGVLLLYLHRLSTECYRYRCLRSSRILHLCTCPRRYPLLRSTADSEVVSE
jgi:hypothetical protein